MTHLFIEVCNILKRFQGLKTVRVTFFLFLQTMRRHRNEVTVELRKVRQKNLPCPQRVCLSALSDFSLRFSEKVGIFVMCFLSGGWPIFSFDGPFHQEAWTKTKAATGLGCHVLGVDTFATMQLLWVCPPFLVSVFWFCVAEKLTPSLKVKCTGQIPVGGDC